MKIAAIPTKWDGVQFRSRLEARFAAFFSSLGWRWEYEPFDLTGWIPDFIIRGADQNLLVEVKPFASDLEAFTEKLNKHGIKPVKGEFEEILFVSHEGVQPSRYCEGMQLGMLGEHDSSSGIWHFNPSCVTLYNGTVDGVDFPDLWGICSDTLSWQDRIVDSIHALKGCGNQSWLPHDVFTCFLKAKFRQAGNVTQWRAP